MRSGASGLSRGRSSRASGLRAPAEGTARSGDPRRALPHRAGSDAPVGLGALPGRLAAGAEGPDSRASLARSRLDRLASPARPVRLVDPRARGGKVDRVVRAPGGAGDQPGGRRVLALMDWRAAGRGRSDECGPQVETG